MVGSGTSWISAISATTKMLQILMAVASFLALIALGSLRYRRILRMQHGWLFGF
jgi:hypothetical protein